MFCEQKNYNFGCHVQKDNVHSRGIRCCSALDNQRMTNDWISTRNEEICIPLTGIFGWLLWWLSLPENIFAQIKRRQWRQSRARCRHSLHSAQKTFESGDVCYSTAVRRGLMLDADVLRLRIRLRYSLLQLIVRCLIELSVCSRTQSPFLPAASATASQLCAWALQLDERQRLLCQFMKN